LLNLIAPAEFTVNLSVALVNNLIALDPLWFILKISAESKPIKTPSAPSEPVSEFVS